MKQRTQDPTAQGKQCLIPGWIPGKIMIQVATRSLKIRCGCANLPCGSQGREEPKPAKTAFRESRVREQRVNIMKRRIFIPIIAWVNECLECKVKFTLTGVGYDGDDTHIWMNQTNNFCPYCGAKNKDKERQP